MTSAVALIPARSGSERVPGKNVRELGGHPLIAYTIAAAQAARVFDAVIVSTDSPEIAAVAESYGAEVPGCARPRWRRRPRPTSSGSGTCSPSSRRMELRRLLAAADGFRGRR